MTFSGKNSFTLKKVRGYGTFFGPPCISSALSDDDEFICDQVNDPRWYKKKKKQKTGHCVLWYNI